MSSDNGSALPYADRVRSLTLEPKRLAGDEALPRAVRALDAPRPEPPRWLVEGFRLASEFGAFVGDGGSLKSTTSLHVSCAIAGGYLVFGRFPAEAGPVLVVSAEDAIDTVMMRIEAIIAGERWDRTRVLGSLHLLCSTELSLGSPRWRTHLSGEVERIRPVYIVLDPWAEMIEGSEDSNSDVRAVVKFCRRVSASVGAALDVVHHVGKLGEGTKRPLDRIRGASALPSATRSIFYFEYTDAGIKVENLKMSRAPRLKPFLLSREITSAPDNRLQWTSARFRIVETPAEARSPAEAFILTQLAMAPGGQRTSTDLRELARGVPGIRREELSAALARLREEQVVTFTDGKQGAKFWKLADRPGAFPGNVADERLPLDLTQPYPEVTRVTGADLTHNLTQPYPEVTRVGSADPTHPFRGVGRVSSPGAEPLDAADVEAQMDERLGMMAEGA